VSASELRRQGLFHFFINPFLLWDLHVLRGLERWNREVGRKSEAWFRALGELEALASLATLAHGDPAATFPEIADATEALSATSLAHPLIPPATRVANDVALRGPGTALVVTGSNMAGKSTLLRAVGLNVALAQAGGPVCAGALRVPRVRLRASMRAEDSLQRGASYFHAELSKLKGVLADAEAAPPILFLLDELLRGTNARARHVGGRAVVLHLLARGATGLVATHDVALSRLADELPDKVDNAHFTDVVVDGEMRFDYRLRPGVVRTSNALRLLALAGVDVAPDTDALAD
jgi:DNA mismatch repair ATPase MutS